MRESARVRLVLERESDVRLALFDVSGRRRHLLVDARSWSAGPHDVVLPRRGLEAGVYWLELRAGDLSARRKLVILP